MGFHVRPLTRTSDRAELIAPGDDAVDGDVLRAWLAEEADAKATDPKGPPHARLQAFREYSGAKSRDLSALPLRPEVLPCFLAVRPLNEREKAIARSDGNRNWGALAYDVCRFGLVEIKNLDGWDPKVEEYHGQMVWTLDTIATLPAPVVQFCALHILALSELSPFLP